MFRLAPLVRVLAAALLVLTLSLPAAAQTSPELAIQHAIERGNSAQTLAIQRRDASIVGDGTGAEYAERLARSNRAMLANGVMHIELVDVEWGPIEIDGATATATAFETWRTSYAAGPTEFGRDRNVYTLSQDAEGAWRVVDNAHPDGRRGAVEPAPPASSEAEPGLAIPPGQGTSRNWAGYAARGGEFTSVSGTWTLPEPALDGPFGSDAAWVGIGGLRTRDLIQAGTQQLVSGTGRVTYQAWYEKLPDYAHPVPLTVLPGHTVTVSVELQGGDTWLITLANLSTGQTLQRTEEYTSTLSSAEWIQEAPYARRRILPLTEFGSISFSAGSAVRDGQRLSIADLNARPISLVDDARRALAVPTPLGVDGASFSVHRS